MSTLARTVLRCVLVAICIVGWSESLLAEDEKEVVIYNDCDDTDLRFALRVRDAGEWKTLSWWSFEPGGIHALADEDSRAVTTNNKIAYFYAVSRNAVWSGDESDNEDRMYEVDGRELRFRQFTFSVDDDDNYFFKISCADTAKQLLQNVIEDANVPEHTEIRIVYEPFRYFYAYLVDKRRYPHVYVVAVNPNDPDASYYTDAGKAGLKRKKAANRNCKDPDQLCSLVRNAKLVLKELDNQQIFFVDLPFNEVVERMARYSNATNASNIDYRYYDRNCAGYAFSFIREALNMDIQPSPPIDPGDDIKVLGWQKKLDVGWRRYRY